MDELSSLPQSDPSTNSLTDEFYAVAFKRIVKNMVLIAAVLILAAFIRFGYRVGVGFLIGCAIAGLNFYWIKRVVGIFADRITQQQTTKPKGTTIRFALRYVFVALFVYVIFKSSVASFNALLAGLFLPVPAILVEASYEVLILLRH